MLWASPLCHSLSSIKSLWASVLFLVCKVEPPQSEVRKTSKVPALLRLLSWRVWPGRRTGRSRRNKPAAWVQVTTRPVKDIKDGLWERVAALGAPPPQAGRGGLFAGVPWEWARRLEGARHRRWVVTSMWRVVRQREAWRLVGSAGEVWVIEIKYYFILYLVHFTNTCTIICIFKMVYCL